MEIINLKGSTKVEPELETESCTRGKITKRAKIFRPAKTYDGLRITDIKQAIKNENRVNVFVNAEYSFSLDIAQLVDFKLKIGTELTPEDIEKYQRASAYGKVYQRTLEWVLSRPHSIRETYDYLNKKQRENSSKKRIKSEMQNSTIKTHNSGDANSKKRTISVNEDILALDKTDIDRIIQTMIEKHYLDDEAYARYYVENRFTNKGISSKRLRLELMKKGINQDIIDQVLSQDIRNDEEEIKKIIAKKRNRYDDDKLTSYLLRQGFDYELVRTLIQQMQDSCGTD